MKQFVVIITLLLSTISLSLANSTFEYKKGEPQQCVAIRGNGERAFAIFSSLARLSDLLDRPFDGVAGASSGSVSAFLYESMIVNPAVRDCRNIDDKHLKDLDGVCSKKEQARRIGLMFKSLSKYTKSVFGTKRILHIDNERVEIDLLDVKTSTDNLKSALIKVLLKEGEIDFKKLIQSDDKILVRDILTIISPDVVRLTKSGEIQKLKEIFEVSKSGSQLAGKDPNTLFRDGLIDMSGVVYLLGRMANFYSDYQVDGKNAHQELWKEFFKTCNNSRNKLWEQLSGNCQTTFDNLFHRSRKRILEGELKVFSVNSNTLQLEKNKNYQGNIYSRHLDKLGKVLPVAIVSSTAVINQTKEFQQAKKNHDSDQYKNSTIENIEHFRDFRPILENSTITSSKNFKIGYWSSQNSLEKIKAGIEKDKNLKKQLSPKLENFYPLGSDNWHEAVTRSAAEPGFTYLQPYPYNFNRTSNEVFSTVEKNVLEVDPKSHLLTSGGWMDANALEVLRYAGCQKTFYITRMGEVSSFGLGVAKFLGANLGEGSEIRNSEVFENYFFKSLELAHDTSVSQADVIWCTDWGGEVINQAANKADQVKKLWLTGFFPAKVEYSSDFQEKFNIQNQTEKSCLQRIK